MSLPRTLSIIKPDGVQQNIIGEIIQTLERERFKILATKMLRLTREAAEGFYAVHRGKPFFDSLTTFMSSGRILVMVLEAENVIERLRELMGATNPEDAGPASLRKRFGTSIECNVIHGSDAPETAAFEIAYFFSSMEILS